MKTPSENFQNPFSLLPATAEEKAALTEKIVFDYRDTNLPGTQVFHGSDRSQIQSILEGPKNLRNGLAGSGLYVSPEYSTAHSYAVSNPLRAGYQNPVVLTGMFNPDFNSGYRVTQTYTGGYNTAINLETGIFPSNWSRYPDIRQYIGDISDIVHYKDPKFGPHTNFFVIRESAGPRAVLWQGYKPVFSKDSASRFKLNDPRMIPKNIQPYFSKNIPSQNYQFNANYMQRDCFPIVQRIPVASLDQVKFLPDTVPYYRTQPLSGGLFGNDNPTGHYFYDSGNQSKLVTYAGFGKKFSGTWHGKIFSKEILLDPLQPKIRNVRWLNPIIDISGSDPFLNKSSLLKPDYLLNLGKYARQWGLRLTNAGSSIWIYHSNLNVAHQLFDAQNENLWTPKNIFSAGIATGLYRNLKPIIGFTTPIGMIAISGSVANAIPNLKEVYTGQLQEMEHVNFPGFTHAETHENIISYDNPWGQFGIKNIPNPEIMEGYFLQTLLAPIGVGINWATVQIIKGAGYAYDLQLEAAGARENFNAMALERHDNKLELLPTVQKTSEPSIKEPLSELGLDRNTNPLPAFDQKTSKDLTKPVSHDTNKEVGPEISQPFQETPPQNTDTNLFKKECDVHPSESKPLPPFDASHYNEHSFLPDNPFVMNITQDSNPELYDYVRGLEPSEVGEVLFKGTDSTSCPINFHMHPPALLKPQVEETFLSNLKIGPIGGGIGLIGAWANGVSFSVVATESSLTITCSGLSGLGAGLLIGGAVIFVLAAIKITDKIVQKHITHKTKKHIKHTQEAAIALDNGLTTLSEKIKSETPNWSEIQVDSIALSAEMNKEIAREDRHARYAGERKRRKEKNIHNTRKDDLKAMQPILWDIYYKAQVNEYMESINQKPTSEIVEIAKELSSKPTFTFIDIIQFKGLGHVINDRIVTLCLTDKFDEANSLLRNTSTLGFCIPKELPAFSLDGILSEKSIKIVKNMVSGINNEIALGQDPTDSLRILNNYLEHKERKHGKSEQITNCREIIAGFMVNQTPQILNLNLEPLLENLSNNAHQPASYWLDRIQAINVIPKDELTVSDLTELQFGTNRILREIFLCAGSGEFEKALKSTDALQSRTQDPTLQDLYSRFKDVIEDGKNNKDMNSKYWLSFYAKLIEQEKSNPADNPDSNIKKVISMSKVIAEGRLNNQADMLAESGWSGQAATIMNELIKIIEEDPNKDINKHTCYVNKKDDLLFGCHGQAFQSISNSIQGAATNFLLGCESSIFRDIGLAGLGLVNSSQIILPNGSSMTIQAILANCGTSQDLVIFERNAEKMLVQLSQNLNPFDSNYDPLGNAGSGLITYAQISLKVVEYFPLKWFLPEEYYQEAENIRNKILHTGNSLLKIYFTLNTINRLLPLFRGVFSTQTLQDLVALLNTFMEFGYDTYRQYKTQRGEGIENITHYLTQGKISIGFGLISLLALIVGTALAPVTWPAALLGVCGVGASMYSVFSKATEKDALSHALSEMMNNMHYHRNLQILDQYVTKSQFYLASGNWKKRQITSTSDIFFQKKQEKKAPYRFHFFNARQNRIQTIILSTNKLGNLLKAYWPDYLNESRWPKYLNNIKWPNDGASLVEKQDLASIQHLSRRIILSSPLINEYMGLCKFVSQKYAVDERATRRIEKGNYVYFTEEAHSSYIYFKDNNDKSVKMPISDDLSFLIGENFVIRHSDVYKQVFELATRYAISNRWYSSWNNIEIQLNNYAQPLVYNKKESNDTINTALLFHFQERLGNFQQANDTDSIIEWTKCYDLKRKKVISTYHFPPHLVWHLIVSMRLLAFVQSETLLLKFREEFEQYIQYIYDSGNKVDKWLSLHWKEVSKSLEDTLRFAMQGFIRAADNAKTPDSKLEYLSFLEQSYRYTKNCFELLKGEEYDVWKFAAAYIYFGLEKEDKCKIFLKNIENLTELIKKNANCAAQIVQMLEHIDKSKQNEVLSASRGLIEDKVLFTIGLGLIQKKAYLEAKAFLGVFDHFKDRPAVSARFTDEYINPQLRIAVETNNMNELQSLLDFGADSNAILTKDGDTALHLAAHYGHLGMVKLLLAKKVRVDIVRSDGMTARLIAKQHGHLDIVQLISRYIADTDVIDNDGTTPLHIAVQDNHVHIVEILLARGANGNAADKDGKTPLQIAVQKGYVDITKILLERGARIDAADKNGLTPLQIAVQNGYADITKILLERLANSRVTDKDGNTLLHIAIRINSLDILTILLKHGASVDATDKNGDTLLHIAVRKNSLDIVMILLKHGASEDATNKNGDTPLHIAVRDNFLYMVWILLARNADRNPTDKDQKTPLHIAVQNGNVHIVKFLLKEGAKVNVHDKNGHTPLYIAALYKHPHLVKILLKNKADPYADDGTLILLGRAAIQGHIHVAKVLLESGVNVNSTGCSWINVNSTFDKDRKTPLYLASMYGRADMVEFLLGKGAYVNIPDSKGRTPLYVAAKNGHINIVNILLDDKKINVNAARIKGTKSPFSPGFWALQLPFVKADCITPLFIAVRYHRLDIIKALLKKGACVNTTRRNGETPLHVAARGGFFEITKLLLENGADSRIARSDGKTPLDLAIQNKRHDVEKVLQAHVKPTVAARMM